MQVDPGFVYKLFAMSPDTYEEVHVGFLYCGTGFECWSMKSVWESNQSEAWKRRPGGAVSGDEARTSLLKIVPYSSSADEGNATFPSGNNFAELISSFFTIYPSGTGGARYVHTTIKNNT